MTLTFIMTVHNGEAVLRRSLQALRAVLQPGDQLVLVDLASQDDSAGVLAGFAQGPGWGDQVAAEIVSVTAKMAQDPSLWASIAAAQMRQPYCLCLAAGDVLQAAAVSALRQLLQDAAPDVLICNQAHYLVSPGARIACVDQARWSEPVADVWGKADQLMADPYRMVLGQGLLRRLASRLAWQAPWQAYETILGFARAQGCDLRLSPEVLRLSPPAPAPETAQAAVMDVLGRLQYVAPQEQGALVTRLRWRLAEALAGQGRDQFGGLCDFLSRVLAQLPVAAWQDILLQGDDLARGLRAFQQGGAAGLAAHLAPVFTDHDQAHLRALRQEVQRLQQDLEVALPGPDDLIEMHNRLRRI